MRRFWFVVAAIGMVLAVSVPGDARTIKSKRVTFEAPVMCTVICAYWLEGFNSDIRESGVKFHECRWPFPAGAYDDVVVRAPAGADLIQFTASPAVDWDIFICKYPARGGKGKTLDTGANTATECQIACPESATAGVEPGKRYVLRAYNWSDPLPLKGRYRFASF